MKEHFEVLENKFVGTQAKFLFQVPDFYKLHADCESVYFELAKKNKVVASIYFIPLGDEFPGIWRSPSRGTFAGMSFSSLLKLDDLYYFYESLESRLKFKGAQTLQISLPPQAIDPQASTLQTYLFRSRGYSVNRCDLNQSLPVDSIAFAEKIKYGNLKRLRKCKQNLILSSKLTTDNLAEVYKVLETNRSQKGRVLSMSLVELEAMVKQFPQKVMLFGSVYKERLVAAAFCIRISEDVLYVFYWGDLAEFNKFSPIVSLAEAIYEYCQMIGIKILDLGTSTIDGVPNFGLFEFKRSLGCVESLKINMEKQL